jgi:hypothetical protein
MFQFGFVLVETVSNYFIGYFINPYHAMREIYCSETLAASALNMFGI